MPQALYRKYRSKSLDEVIGQEHITSTLANALKAGKISHAYLFTGPRGVGKTSIARILAHQINGLDYTDESSHLDIIEIDAASNRRIDEIRELRDKVNVAPSAAKYKVYIIDEVHMLTREAFNALLKTLEEPPAHVVFILATTEVHKLPDTIISRTQRYTFKPVPEAQVVKHLKYLAEQEGITISDEALQLIARHGGGSFRDSISLLDQMGGPLDGRDGEVGLDQVRLMLGIPSEEAIQELYSALQAADAGAVIRQLDALSGQGFEAPHIAKQLAAVVRTAVIGGDRSAAALELLGKLVNIPAAYNPSAQLELTLLDYALQRNGGPAPTSAPLRPAAPVAAPTPIAAKPALKPAPAPAPAAKPVEPAPAAPPPAAEAPAPAIPAGGGKPLSPDLWPEVLAALKSHTTLFSIVRTMQPEFSDSGITLRCNSAFYQKRVNDAKNQNIIAAAIQSLTGFPVAVSCVLDKAASSEVHEAAATPAGGGNTLSAINNIFGGGEVLN